MSGIIPIPKDNASGQFNAGISASSLALVLKAGEGASFPQPITDSATSLGSGTLLNCTGIQALGVAVGDFIYNLTDSTPSTDTWSGAVVLAVSANSVTTSPLTGGSDNLWQSSDEWAVKPFVVNASIRTGAVLTGAVTQYEKILITERSTDTLSMPVASGYRGFDGTTPNTFSADDFVTIEVDQSISDGMRIALANVFIQKAEKDDTMLLDGSNAMTAALQMGSNKITGLGDGVNPQDAVTRAQLDAVASASSLTGERDNTFAVRVISWNTATVGGNYEVKRGVGVVDSGANVDGSGSYRDSVPLSGDIEYTVEVTDDEDVRVITPILYFDNTVDDVVPVGYYGDGGDGAFAGGAIERGSVYNFSSFILASDAVFSAGGKTIIFVEGDLTIPSAWKLDFESGTQTTTKDDDTFFPESISVGGSGYATATGESSGGTGGAGGTIGGNAGGAGGTGKFGIGGIGGNGGSHGSAGSAGTGGGGGRITVIEGDNVSLGEFMTMFDKYFIYTSFENKEKRFIQEVAMPIEITECSTDNENWRCYVMDDILKVVYSKSNDGGGFFYQSRSRIKVIMTDSTIQWLDINIRVINIPAYFQINPINANLPNLLFKTANDETVGIRLWWLYLSAAIIVSSLGYYLFRLRK